MTPDLSSSKSDINNNAFFGFIEVVGFFLDYFLFHVK